MKILFTGGGSGGHFYPIIAIAEELQRIAGEERLIPPRLFFMAPEPYDADLLFEHGIAFIPIPSGKWRRYFSFRNITDMFKIVAGVLKAIFFMFRLYPDIVVGKGGFGSFPALVAARLWNIPVFIHESDTVPGRVSRFAGRFAARVALSFPQASSAFLPGMSAHTGNPIRSELTHAPMPRRQAFGLAEDTRIIFVIGGSLGSTAINEALLQALPALLSKYEIIHQTGRANLSDIRARSEVILQNDPMRRRYHTIGYLSGPQVAAAGLLASLIVSRAGSTIFEIAVWGKPSILIPITDSSGDHQRENAYAYAENGAARVVEEGNLTGTILAHEIDGILGNEALAREMSARALHFAKPGAASVIAREILDIALKHER